MTRQNISFLMQSACIAEASNRVRMINIL